MFIPHFITPPPIQLGSHYWATQHTGLQRSLDDPVQNRCALPAPYEAHVLGWGNAGTQHAFEAFRYAPAGFCSAIDVQAGAKLLIIARPKGLLREPLPLKASRSVSLSDNLSSWDLEAVVLTPGTRL